MLEIVGGVLKNALLWMVTNGVGHTPVVPQNNQNQGGSNVKNNKVAYQRLGRQMMYCAGIAGLNAVRTISIDKFADTLNIPMFKHINSIDNYLTVAVLQQCLFMGVCNRFDVSQAGKMMMTTLQCVLLATAFYRDFKVASIACSLAICLPIKYSKAADFGANVQASIKEIFNFE